MPSIGLGDLSDGEGRLSRSGRLIAVAEAVRVSRDRNEVPREADGASRAAVMLIMGGRGWLARRFFFFSRSRSLSFSFSSICFPPLYALPRVLVEVSASIQMSLASSDAAQRIVSTSASPVLDLGVLTRKACR